jgi:hypothetical protein
MAACHTFARMPKRFVSRFALAIPVAVVVAVSLGGGWLAEAKRGRARAPAAEAVDCKTDGDCVVVVDDCCPCSQGGKQRAIPKKDKAGYEKDRKKRCTDTACTEMISQDPTCSQRAFCGAGICELGDPAP